MKKLLLKLLSLVPVLAAGISLGQGLPNVYQSPANGNQCKVEYDVSSRNHIIFSDPYGSYNHFSLTDITNSTIDVRQPSSYVINDFEIFEGYVIFCGHTFANEGLIGWFKIDDFFNQNQSAYVDHTLTVLGLSDLADIEVYRDVNNYVHIAGVGSSSSSPLPHNIGFEAFGTFPMGMKYRVASFYTDVYDLTVTDNYVVYVGNYDSTGVTLYSFPKNDIFSPGLHPSVCFPVSIIPQVIEPISPENLRIVHTIQDSVATISYRVEVSSMIPIVVASQNMVLRTYDVGVTNIQMVDAYKMTLPGHSYSDWGKVAEFKYGKALRTYYALYKMYWSSSSYVDAVAEFDLSSGTPTTIHNYYSPLPNINMTGFCLRNSPYYTVCGFDTPNYFSYYWQGEHNSIINNCVMEELMPSTMLPNVVEKSITNVHSITSFVPLVFLAEPREPQEGYSNGLICE